MAEMELLDLPQLPDSNSDVYDASYIISPRSICRITVWGANNYKKMVSVIDTIHTTEAA